VFAVGVANYVLEELNTIATSPELVDELDSFNLLLQNQQSRSYFICFKGTARQNGLTKIEAIYMTPLSITEQQAVMMEEEQNGVIPMGSVSRLRFSGPGNEGVTVRICIDQGVIIVYGSYTVPNPNAALYDFSRILRAAEGEVTPSNCLISHVNIEDVARNRRDCSQCGTTNTSGGRGRKKRQAGKDEAPIVTVFITIEGASDMENHFSVNSSFGTAFGE